MRFRSFLVRLVLLALFIAAMGTGYIFVATIVFKDTTYAGFYNSWAVPDAAGHLHRRGIL